MKLYILYSDYEPLCRRRIVLTSL